ncbi:MAG: hypothetical protein QF675_11780, partial [SAR324 cluster bacterium]|nr:hypothetical protein [SAR324 cluster bacterium]
MDLNLPLQVLTPFRIDQEHSLENIIKVWSYDGNQWESYSSASGGSLTTLDAGAGSWFLVQNQPSPVTETSPLVILPSNSVNPILWTRSTGPPGGGIWSISISPSNPSVIYAPTYDLNVLKSIDGGDSWNQIGERVLGAHIFAPVLVDPLDENRILVSNGILHSSTDGGQQLLNLGVGSGEDRGVVSLDYAPSDPNWIYAALVDGRIYRSSDRGLNFTLMQTLSGFKPRTVLRVDPFDRKKIYVVAKMDQDGDEHILTSSDEGTTFLSIRSHSKIHSLVLDPADSLKIYYSTDDRVYRSTDGATSWSQTEDGGILALSPSNPSTLFLLTLNGELFASTDGAVSFSEIVHLEILGSGNHEGGEEDEDHHGGSPHGGLTLAVDP